MAEPPPRGLVIALVATEQWQFTRTDTDSEGHARTETVTRRDELRRVPVQLLGPTALAEGESRDLDIEIPVPPLGPASLDATVSALSSSGSASSHRVRDIAVCSTTEL